MSNIFANLKAPFPPEKISWRVGATTSDKKKGLALAYIDARDVMERLDSVCQPENWQSDPHGAGDGMLSCRIGIKSGGEWIWKGDGAGGREANAGLAEQDANKGNFSDAFKRAAVMWGIGRYLYDIQSIWVELDERKQIRSSELPKLLALLGGKKVAKVEPAIVPQELDASVKKYGDEIDATLKDLTTPDNVMAFWTSAEQQAKRKQLQLGQTDLEFLKTKVGKRLKELERKAA